METFDILFQGNRITADLDFINHHFSEVERSAVILEAAKFDALRGVDNQHASIMRRLTGNASIEERDTWQSKELAARALIGETAIPSQIEMLTIEAQYRGVTAEQLATVIINRADDFKRLIGLAAGIRSKTRVAIEAADTPEAVSMAIEQAQIETAQAISQIGN